MGQASVVIKGRKDHLEIILNAQCTFEHIYDTLQRKLEANRHFFASADANCALVSGKQLDSAQKQEIEAILTNGYRMSKVQFAQEEAQMPAGDSLDDGLDNAVSHAAPVAQAQEEEPLPAENILLSQPQTGKAMIFNETLRSGNRVVYDGHVVVLGDVNNGASVVASGNIIVMGALRGLAHAGAFGDENAYIIATRMEARQLRIAAQIGVAPEGKSPKATNTEYARLCDGTITIEPYTGNMRNL